MVLNSCTTNRNTTPFERHNIAVPTSMKGKTATHPLKQLAKECVKEYQRKMNQPNSNTFNTKWVSFPNYQLEQWLSAMKGANTIKLKLGIYTSGYITAVNDCSGQSDGYGGAYPSLKLIDTGRLTIFLFPCTNDDTTTTGDDNAYFLSSVKESSAYNLGNLHP